MASECSAAYWESRYHVLYEACLNLLPQVENQWGTDEVEDFCFLMYRLMKEGKN